MLMPVPPLSLPAVGGDADEASASEAVRLFYVTQATNRPPTFVAMTNEPDAVHFSYQRYVINSLRERFGFEGTPVRVFYRKRCRCEEV